MEMDAPCGFSCALRARLASKAHDVRCIGAPERMAPPWNCVARPSANSTPSATKLEQMSLSHSLATIPPLPAVERRIVVFVTCSSPPVDRIVPPVVPAVWSTNVQSSSDIVAPALSIAPPACSARLRSKWQRRASTVASDACELSAPALVPERPSTKEHSSIESWPSFMIAPPPSAAKLDRKWQPERNILPLLTIAPPWLVVPKAAVALPLKKVTAVTFTFTFTWACSICSRPPPSRIVSPDGWPAMAMSLPGFSSAIASPLSRMRPAGRLMSTDSLSG
mmetsp:Transcript_60982/g.167205  ORF Transcript_60982/g.167205 Transcript_60982/m.167205 type:complete len:279 (-) Transcript_60982:208-1044(-)